MTLTLLDWLVIAGYYAALFGSGKVLFGETGIGLVLLGLSGFCGLLISRDLSLRQQEISPSEGMEA